MLSFNLGYTGHKSQYLGKTSFDSMKFLDLIAISHVWCRNQSFLVGFSHPITRDSSDENMKSIWFIKADDEDPPIMVSVAFDLSLWHGMFVYHVIVHNSNHGK